MVTVLKIDGTPDKLKEALEAALVKDIEIISIQMVILPTRSPLGVPELKYVHWVYCREPESPACVWYRAPTESEHKNLGTFTNNQEARAFVQGADWATALPAGFVVSPVPALVLPEGVDPNRKD